MWIPVFLNCWLAKDILENMFNDLHRLVLKQQSAISQKVLILLGTVVCIVFTCVCGVHHLERATSNWTFFKSLWFVVVTFSTVGYGDTVTTDWPAQTFVMCMIITAFSILPTELEQLVFLLVSRQKEGGAYSGMLAGSERHVVLCATQLSASTLIDFLNEFYAAQNLQDVHVVLLSPTELEGSLKILLQVPVWAQRVTYLKGSVLKDQDLIRARVEEAAGCFILSDRNNPDREIVDQHTILRTWAVQDFAPATPLYVQILKPENKFHVTFAEHVVCEDEIKYALLANNCVCPGISTLVTLLLHTLHEQKGSQDQKWHEVYGRCAGNEIYDIKLGKSQIFRPYAYKSYTHAAFHAHRKYGVTLIAVRREEKGASILLNPGPSYIMAYDDTCFYMSICSEENTGFKVYKEKKEKEKRGGLSRDRSVITTSTIALEIRPQDEEPQETSSMKYLNENRMNGTLIANLDRVRTSSQADMQTVNATKQNGSFSPLEVSEDGSRRPSSPFVPDDSDLEDDPEDESEMDLGTIKMTSIPQYVVGVPPVSPYIGRTPVKCHLLPNPREACCLQLNKGCEHRGQGKIETQRQRGAIIVATPIAQAGLYNFILPLRAFNRPKCTLKPIVLLLSKEPSEDFIEAVCSFPMLYFMIGTINSLDDLLVAGILHADSIVVSHHYLQGHTGLDEEYMADANTIVGVQTIFRLFPKSHIIVELAHPSNMRFMQFSADPVYFSEDEASTDLRKSIRVRSMRKAREAQNKKDHLNYMFRENFAAGDVFSASMIDTLLYQAFVKPYMITLISLLLGCEQAPGTGYLCALEITKDQMWLETYGRLFQRLCSTTCEIPIGLYRTETHCNDNNVCYMEERKEMKDIYHIIGSRMNTLGINNNLDMTRKDGFSYVIVNPVPETKLAEGDIVYLIRPCGRISVSDSGQATAVGNHQWESSDMTVL